MEIMQQILSALAALAMTLSAQVASLPPSSQLAQVFVPSSGLVGYWNLDEGSGTTISDSSGNGNTGTISGATWAAGKVGSGALSFDGVSNYVTVDNNSLLNPSEITISFWIKFASCPSNSNGSIIDKNYTAGYRVRSTTTCAPQILFNNTIGAIGAVAPLNVWTHYVIVGNSSGTRVYTNGVAGNLDTDAYVASASTGSLFMNKGGGLSNIPAVLDEVRIYNRVLSAQEISDIYTSTSGTVTSPVTPPVTPPSSGDTQAPNTPTNLSASAVSSSQVNLTWLPSTDNVGVTGYKIYRNGSQISTTVNTSYSDVNLSASTNYSYTVSAYDAAGNNSAQSSSASATTQSMVSQPTNNTYTVKQDGSGNFTTIQACANVVQAGQTCLVYPGTYSEHVVTKAGGTSGSNRVIFKAQGLVVTKGFDIKHQYVTVDGFDMSGLNQQWGYLVNVIGGANYCQIINNDIRDDSLSGGITFTSTGGIYADHCEIKYNTIKNLGYGFLSTNGGYHIVENNTFSRLNSRDFIFPFGHGHVFRNNMFLEGNSIAGVGNHPDWVQTFGDYDAESYDILFDHNWVQDLDAQLGQLNSQTNLSPTVPAVLSTKIHDWTFRNNVFINTSANMTVSIPGATFMNNTFYHAFMNGSGLGFGGTLKRGDSSRALLKNNVFVGGGSKPDPYGYRGYYSKGRGNLSKEVLYPLSSDQTVGAGIFNDMVSSGYIDSNGILLDKVGTVTDISQFTLSSTYASYKSAVYDLLTRTIQLDNSIKSTSLADYNFIAEDAPGFVAKATRCTDPRYTYSNFCEPHGINGGDPKFTNITNPLGQDGVPFTADDGLIPLSGSLLCGNGDSGADIGAYSCSGSTVGAPVISSFIATPASLSADNSTTTLSWSVSGASNVSINQNIGTVIGSSKTISPAITTTYILTATNSYGSATRSVTVTVTPIYTTSSNIPATPVLPSISNLLGSNITQSSTKISWNTNVLTSGQVFYGNTVNYDLSSVLIDSSPKTTAHAITLSNLSPSTLYHFKVTSVDANNQSTSSPDFSFTTLAAPSNNTSVGTGSTGGNTTTSGGASTGVVSGSTVSVASTATSASNAVVYIPVETTSTKITTVAPQISGSLTRNLIPASKGDDVKILQNFLVSQGYLTTDNVTGLFGPITQKAVQTFQTTQGLVSSGSFWTTGYGMVGPATRAKINSLLGTSSTSVNTSTTQNNPTVTILTRNLFRGAQGDDVKILQNFLINQGYLSPGNAIGYFGLMTEEAVKKFQASQGVVSAGTPQTTGYGNVGSMTRSKINSMLGTSTTSSNADLKTQIDAMQKQVQDLLLKLQKTQ